MRKELRRVACGFLAALIFCGIFSTVAKAAAPLPVANPTIVNETYNSITVNWTAPVDNGTTISDYQIEYLAPNSSWTIYQHSPSVNTSMILLGLTPDTSYDLRISTVYSDGSISTPVEASFAFSKADAGEYFGCALSADQNVYCWGKSEYLGDGSTTESLTPRLVLLPEKATQISIGGFSSCALGLSGAVYCWGANNYGQLGDGSNTTVNVPVNVPVQVATLTNIVSIAVGGVQGSDGHACAVDKNDIAYCWGSNNYGQLGDGTLTQHLKPVQVSSPNGIGFTKVAAGGTNTCFIGTDANAYCTGDNTFGQLGIGLTPGTITTPQLVIGVTSVRKIVLGTVQSCAMTSTNQLYCWGSNIEGQIGNVNFSYFTQPQLISLAGSPMDVGIGHQVICPVFSTGQITCLGNSYYLPMNLGSGNTFNQIDGGPESMCATSTANQVYCWGFIYRGGVNSTYNATNAPFASFASTLNVPVPEVTQLSASNGPVGAPISIAGNFLQYATKVTFGTVDASFQFNSTTQSLIVVPPLSLAVGTSYSISVTSFGGVAIAATSFLVTTSPIVTVNLSVSTIQSGSPTAVVGGQYTWLSQGRFSPSSPTMGDNSGNATLANVVAGPGQIILSGGQLPDGTTVSGSWNVTLANGPLALQANPPTAPPLITASAIISFPDATPVPGAVLTASGLSGSYADSNSNYALTYFTPSAITSAVSDANGLAILYGYQSSPTVSAVATYNDTVLIQSTQPTILTPNGSAIPLSFDYAPFLTTSTPALTAVSGSLASMSFSDLNYALTNPAVANQTVTLTEVSVTSPLAAMGIKAATAPACPTIFTGVTDASGNVSIPLCTSVSGLHTYNVTSLGSISQNSSVTMEVTTPVVATTVGLSGPSSGVVNRASTNFTVTPDGTYSGVVTVTVSGGGMNNTIPLSFTNSAVPQTFTINPISTGNVTLSVATFPLLTNPIPLTYLVNPAPATSYTLAGPTSGAQGVASTIFTVSPNGVYTGTITVSVTGAGLNTAIPLTFTNSSVSQTFTITPPSTGTVILNPTSLPRLGNAIAHTYSVSQAGLIPALTITNVTTTSFIVNVTNYDPVYTFRATSNLGVVSKGTSTLTNQSFNVTGLTAGQSATVLVTSSRNGFAAMSASILGSAAPVNQATLTIANTTLTGTVGTPITLSTTGGSGGGAVSYTFTGASCAIATVSLSASAATTCVVTATKAASAGFNLATSVSKSFVFVLPGLLPTFSAPVVGATSFTVTITNYNALYTYAFASTSGVVTRGTSVGASLPLTISGLTNASRLTTVLTVTVSRTGYATRTSTVTG